MIEFLTWKRIGCKWLFFEQNSFGYKEFHLHIGSKDRFFYIQITNRPILWAQLYWDYNHNYGYVLHK